MKKVFFKDKKLSEKKKKKLLKYEEIIKTWKHELHCNQLNLIKEIDINLNYLSFSSKRISIDIKKALQSAIANAENNHQLDVDKLYIHEASVGRGLVMKRFKARAKGRGVRILKPFSNLTIKLKEQEENIEL